MTVPFWQPSTFYSPGATVRPITQPPTSTPVIPNGTFESGNTEWDTETNWAIITQAEPDEPPFQGSYYAQFSGSGASDSRIISETNFPVRVGQRIKASCMVRRKRTSYTGGRVELDWLDENEALIFTSQGNTIETTGSTTGNWRKSEVEAFAPAGAAFVRVAGFAYRTQGAHVLFLDSFTWDYSYTAEGAGLVFTAVQPASGFSGATEPAWPTVNGQQVVDNEVTWEAIEGTRVVWEANPIIVSGYIEPDWPLQVGAAVSDNTAIWTAVSRQVTDEKCPHSAIVAIATSKVFAGDDDIIAFSATVNPLDWSAEDDAGYLPFGLQTFGAMPVTALGLYRGNLAAFNSQGYQIWQIGEDPENHALLDAGPIGCIWPRTPLAVMNDLVFLSAVGVRNIGVAGASTNLQVGNFGQAVDPLVLAKLQAGEFEPFSLYVPAYGQYWLFFGDEAFVLTINGVKQMSWSRYTFPEAITDWTLDGNDLLLRTETHTVWRVSVDALYDDVVAPVELGFTPGNVGGAVEGFESRTFADSGITGAPFGDLDPTFVLDTISCVYFEWSEDEGSGDTTFAFALTDGGFEVNPIFDTISFEDDDGVTWTLQRADALEPAGQTGTYDGGDLTHWQWTFADTAQPNVTEGQLYPISIVLAPDYAPPGDIDIVGTVQWPHLDLGSFGVEKQFIGFDLVATAPEGVSISIGYDQRDLDARTTDYLMDADSLPGKLVPIPLTAPSFDMRLTFEPGQAWEWNASCLYIQERRTGS